MTLPQAQPVDVRGVLPTQAIVQSVIYLAEQLGKVRCLSEIESLMLERAIRFDRPTRRWSAPDDRRLRDLAARGQIAGVIAKRLGRTEKAIYSRARVLGVRFRRNG